MLEDDAEAFQTKLDDFVVQDVTEQTEFGGQRGRRGRGKGRGRGGRFQSTRDDGEDPAKKYQEEIKGTFSHAGNFSMVIICTQFQCATVFLYFTTPPSLLLRCHLSFAGVTCSLPLLGYVIFVFLVACLHRGCCLALVLVSTAQAIHVGSHVYPSCLALHRYNTDNRVELAPIEEEERPYELLLSSLGGVNKEQISSMLRKRKLEEEENDQEDKREKRRKKGICCVW